MRPGKLAISATALCFAIGVAWPGADAAVAQSYPGRAIRIIVTQPAGGPLDIYARSIGEKLSTSLKQPVVIDNRPGAGGNIGAEMIARAVPDGYTLGMVLGTTLTINPTLYKALPFDPERDFRPIAIVTTSGNMLVVHPSIPANSVTEFVAYAKATAAKGEPLNYASGGIGNPGHLAMEYFRAHAGFEAIHVPYRGNAPMVVDLVSGQVRTAFVATSGMMDHVRAGRLKGLGVSHAQRSPLTQDIPTIAESGYPGFHIENLSVLLAPAGIREPVVALLEREVRVALERPDVTERFRSMGTLPTFLAGAELQARIKSDRDTWAKVVSDKMRLD